MNERINIDDHVKCTGTGAFAGKTGFVKSLDGNGPDATALVLFDGDFPFEGRCRVIDLVKVPVLDAPPKDVE